MAIAIMSGYAVLTGAMLATEAWARWRAHGSATMGDVLTMIMRTSAGRWFVMLAWVWLGWHLFVRATP